MFRRKHKAVDLVISTATRKDLATWLVSIKRIGYLNSRDYLLIVPEQDKELFLNHAPKGIRVCSDNEYGGEFIGELSVATSINPSRRGWYLQQFLKLEALRRNTHLNRILIWDADTIPLRRINFFGTASLKYYVSSEYNLPYFQAIERLMGLQKTTADSFIGQSFPIFGNQAAEFFRHIEDQNGTIWWRAIIDAVDFSIDSGFSEYEALGTWVSNTKRVRMLTSSRWTRLNVAAGSEGRKFQRIFREFIAKLVYDFYTIESSSNVTSSSALFDHYKAKLQNTFSIKLAEPARKFLRKILNSFFHKAALAPTDKTESEMFIDFLFATQPNLHIVQIGANDGIQNDPLRTHLVNPKNYTAVLIEPLPSYVDKLKELYEGRKDVSVRNVACGMHQGVLDLHHIPSELVDDLNGRGPKNNWSLGQGASLRSTVVYWIYRNSFRGRMYKRNIPRFISSIERVSVPIVRTETMLPDDVSQCLLVVDVQGMELEVLLGLNQRHLPAWIMIEQDLGDLSASDFLLTSGYSQITKGNDIVFGKQ